MTDDPTPSEQNNPTSDDMRLAEEWANSGRTVGALPHRQRPKGSIPRTA
ncbi:CopG family transcriptional regulator, partial [Cutibacterium acnes]